MLGFIAPLPRTEECAGLKSGQIGYRQLIMPESKRRTTSYVACLSLAIGFNRGHGRPRVAQSTGDSIQYTTSLLIANHRHSPSQPETSRLTSLRSVCWCYQEAVFLAPGPTLMSHGPRTGNATWPRQDFPGSREQETHHSMGDASLGLYAFPLTWGPNAHIYVE